MATITPESPLAAQLVSSVHSKIVDQGWTQEDDNSLAEYIVLMLANGKTQEQIASELAGELLQDAEGTEEFAQWLFDQVAAVTGQNNTTNDNAQSVQLEDSTETVGDASIPAAYDQDMGESAPDNAPRGPKGLHGGRGGARGRGRGDRSGDSALHRTRGNDRINSHVRGAPRGPRGGREVRPGMQKALNGLAMGSGAQAQMAQNAQNGQGGMMPAMSAQQQMEFMAMMEQQARMMASMVQGMNGNSNFSPTNSQNGGGRSLFDRVDNGRGRGGRGRGRGGAAQNGGARKQIENAEEAQQGDASSQMDVETSTQATADAKDPATTMCYFNTRCTNATCPYVHQSPAAPEGITVDMDTTCTFGSRCTNAKCVGKHPSPHQKKAQAAEELCKYFPNCANPMCPFKHPTMPLCAYGASCNATDCKFTHLDTKCRYNPCMNARCPYTHEPGQNKTFADFSWSAGGGGKQPEQTGSHVSNRKFVEDEGAEEELIKPTENAQEGQQPASEVTA